MNWSKEVIQSVWNKGIVVESYNPDLYRHDYAGAWISRNDYGNTDSIYGWEIDHVWPVAKGGKDDMINLRPMNWRNNRSKDDDYPNYIADVVAKDNKNIEQETNCTVNKGLQQQLEILYGKH